MQLGPLGTNCYIIYVDNQALIVDPGGDAEKVIAFVEQHDLIPQAIILTHAHFDHIGAVQEIREHYKLEVYLHEQEKHWLEDPVLNRSILMGTELKANAPDQLLVPGEVNIGSFHFKVLHTPGHSPGSTSFVFFKEKFVIAGDVLFRSGVGRTDLPQGDFKQLENSIRNHLYQLPDEFVVYPGHGPKTTIGEEKRTNPFFSITG